LGYIGNCLGNWGTNTDLDWEVIDELKKIEKISIMNKNIDSITDVYKKLGPLWNVKWGGVDIRRSSLATMQTTEEESPLWVIIKESRRRFLTRE
jgi:hypothetical protein